MKNKLIPFLFISIFSPFLSFAQDIEMADTFRSEGKIYIVIAGMTLILAGLFIYLFSIGNKISRLEKKLGNGNKK